jgi:hypothetical protein
MFKIKYLLKKGAAKEIENYRKVS